MSPENDYSLQNKRRIGAANRNSRRGLNGGHALFFLDCRSACSGKKNRVLGKIFTPLAGFLGGWDRFRPSAEGEGPAHMGNKKNAMAIAMQSPPEARDGVGRTVNTVCRGPLGFSKSPVGFNSINCKPRPKRSQRLLSIAGGGAIWRVGFPFNPANFLSLGGDWHGGFAVGPKGTPAQPGQYRERSFRFPNFGAKISVSLK